MLRVPTGVCLDAYGRVYVANCGSIVVTVHDFVTGDVIQRLEVPGRPVGVTVTRMHGALVVTHDNPSGIVVFE